MKEKRCLETVMARSWDWAFAGENKHENCVCVREISPHKCVLCLCHRCRSIAKPADLEKSTINLAEIHRWRTKKLNWLFLSLLFYRSLGETERKSCRTTLNVQYLCHQSLRKRKKCNMSSDGKKANDPEHEMLNRSVIVVDLHRLSLVFSHEDAEQKEENLCALQCILESFERSKVSTRRLTRMHYRLFWDQLHAFSRPEVTDLCSVWPGTHSTSVEAQGLLKEENSLNYSQHGDIIRLQEL